MDSEMSVSWKDIEDFDLPTSVRVLYSISYPYNMAPRTNEISMSVQLAFIGCLHTCNILQTHTCNLL